MRIVSIFSAGFIILSTIPGSASIRAWSSLRPMSAGLCAFSARMRAAVPSARARSSSFSAAARSRVARAVASAIETIVPASLRTRVSSTSACSAARMRASARSRSAAAVSREVRTRSSASASRARASCTPISAAACSMCFAAILTALSARTVSVESSASICWRRSSRSRAISDVRTSRSRPMRAASRRRSEADCSSATSAWLAARAVSISRCCTIVASSSSWERRSFCLVVLSWLWRTETSASDSISARFFRLTAMISARRRIPRALNALFSSRAWKGVWSRRVSDTDSSRRPFWARSSPRTSLTAAVYRPRSSWRLSMV